MPSVAKTIPKPRPNIAYSEPIAQPLISCSRKSSIAGCRAGLLRCRPGNDLAFGRPHDDERAGRLGLAVLHDFAAIDLMVDLADLRERRGERLARRLARNRLQALGDEPDHLIALRRVDVGRSVELGLVRGD